MYRSSTANASASPPLTPSHRSAVPPGAGAGVPASSSLAWSLSLPAASSSLLAARSNAKLLGVALVVSGDFGTRTVFRHPIPPAARKKNDDSSHGNQSSASGGVGSSSNGLNPQLLHPSSSSGVGLDTLGASPPSPAMAPKLGGGEESDSERDNSTNGAGAGGGSNNGSSDQATGKTTTAVHATGEEMYGMSPDDFARLFCTKSSLCARVLDVSVDALRFVSFPIRLRFQDSRTRLAKQRRAREKMRARERMKANLKANQASKRKHKDDEKQTQGDESGAASVDAALTSSTELKKDGSEEKDGDAAARESGQQVQVEDGDAAEQEDAFDANNNSVGDDDDLDENDEDEDDEGDGGDLSFESDDEEDGEDGESAPLGSSEHDLTFFNVVFILNGAVSQTLASMYGNVAALLARALLHEQTRAHFVSQQAQMMVSIRDKYLNAVARAVGSGMPQRSGRPNLHVDLHVLSRLLLQHSLLANHLHQLYYGLLQQEYERFGTGSTISSFQAIQDDLSQGAAQMSSRSNLATVEGVAAVNAAFAKLGSTLAGSSQGSYASSAAARSAAQKLLQLDHSHTHLLINGWFQLHFSLTPSLLHPMYNPHSAPTQPLPLVLKPYQTLLLTVPIKNLLASLPADCNPLLRTLVSHANPLHSFARLAQNLRIPFNHFSQLVSHLLYWNKGVLIDAISSENCYVLNEKVASMAATPGTSSGRARPNQISASSTARRSISARPGMTSFSPASIPSSNSSTGSSAGGGSSSSNTAAAAAAAAAAQQQLKMRRRSSSVDAPPPLPLPSFLPPALLYEWCTMFPQSGVGGLLAFLTRISNPLARSRTLGQHLQRLTVTANQAAASANSTSNSTNTTTTVSGSSSSTASSERGGGTGTSSSSSNSSGGGVSASVSSVVGAGSTVSTTASASTASLAHRLRSKLHADFIAQLVFLLQKRWVVQQQQWLIRLEDEDTADEDEESEEEESDEDGDGRGYAGRISASSSVRSLRSLYGSTSSNDLTRQNSAASKEDGQQQPQQQEDAAAGNGGDVPTQEADPWFALLERLTPLYFDGKHSVTEILWSERDTGLTLQHLQHLLKLYPSQLISVMHP